jgi:acyl-CoA synthetase (AMP-forming)/AMP-acid ligase II
MKDFGMQAWTPDLGLMKALMALNAGETPVVLTEPDRDLTAWAEERGYRVTIVAGVCEIWPGDRGEPPRKLEP